MLKSKRIISFVVSLSFLASLLIVSLPYTTSASSQKKVNLRFMWWGGEARHKATLAAIDLYMKKNPNVKINAEYGGVEGYLQKLITQLVGKTAPDIIQIDSTWVPELSAQGDFFVDLKTQKVVNSSSFEDVFLKQFCYVGNKLIGLPTGINAGVLLYNRDFFKKYGISEKMNWTWEDLVAVASDVHKKNKNAYLFNFDSTICTYVLKTYVLQKTGGNWVNDDYSIGFDRNTLISAFTYLDNLFKVGAIQPFRESAPFEGKPEQNPKWMKGELGILWNWTSTYAANKAIVPNLSITMVPVAKNAKSNAVSVRPSQILTVNKYSKNITEAAKFLNWFLNDEEAALTLTDVRGIPASSISREVLGKNNKLDPILVKATNEAIKRAAKPENGISQNQELEKISKDVIQQLAYKQLNPTKAADELIKRYHQKLEELKNIQQ